MRQCTALDLCIPKVDITAADDPELARWKGSRRSAGRTRTARHSTAIQPPDRRRARADRRPSCTCSTPALIADWVDTAKSGVVPINQRRERLRVLAQQDLRRRNGGEDFWSPGRPDEVGDQRLLADAASDHARRSPAARCRRAAAGAGPRLISSSSTRRTRSSTARRSRTATSSSTRRRTIRPSRLRVIGRRSPGGSITMVGDVAQSTTPAGQERWADVFAHLGAAGSVADLTIGYRVPEPILDVANRLLPLTGVDAVASRSVRGEGEPPAWHTATPARCRPRHRRGRHRGQAPAPPHRRRGPGRVARRRSPRRWRRSGWSPSTTCTSSATTTCRCSGRKRSRASSSTAWSWSTRTRSSTARRAGARLLYVAMTRAVQELAFVASAPPPCSCIA